MVGVSNAVSGGDTAIAGKGLFGFRRILAPEIISVPAPGSGAGKVGWIVLDEVDEAGEAGKADEADEAGGIGKVGCAPGGVGKVG